MLVQARATLKDRPHVHVERVQIGTGEIVGLPSARESFDPISCTNTLHDIPDPEATLAGLGGYWYLEDNWWWKISLRVSLVSSGQLSNGCCGALKETT